MAWYIGARNRQNRSYITPQHMAAFVVQGGSKDQPGSDTSWLVWINLNFELDRCSGVACGRACSILIHQNFFHGAYMPRNVKALNTVQTWQSNSNRVNCVMMILARKGRIATDVSMLLGHLDAFLGLPREGMQQTQWILDQPWAIGASVMSF